MSNAYTMFETDHKLEKDGLTVDYGPFWVKVAFIGEGTTDKRVLKIGERIYKPYGRAIASKTIDPKKLQELNMEFMAEAGVLAWGGNIFKDGVERPCNKQNVLKLFKELPKLYIALKKDAEDWTQFRKEAEELDAKNSKGSSSTG